MSIPKLIFIVPYRDREAQKNMFTRMMEFILEDDNYEIYYAHQKDDRPFNRGAMKNLGFLYVKDKYPQDYKNITFVFNDVDTLPGIKNLWDYTTKKGEVKHFYGYKFALGGIVSILGEDFERINGYPNFWGWGFEDNTLNIRCINNGININRNKFYAYGHNDILQFNNSLERKIDDDSLNKYRRDNGKNGIDQISNIKYKETSISRNNYIIDFTTWTIPEKYKNIKFETRNAPNKIYPKKKTNKGSNMMGSIIGFR